MRPQSTQGAVAFFLPYASSNSARYSSSSYKSCREARKQFVTWTFENSEMSKGCNHGNCDIRALFMNEWMKSYEWKVFLDMCTVIKVGNDVNFSL